MEVVAMVPGAVSAGTEITLPGYAKPISALVAALKTGRVSITHAACAATSAAYATATTLGTPINVLTSLTIVDTTPSAGQIQVTGDNTVVLGDDLQDGDLLILIYVGKGDLSCF